MPTLSTGVDVDSAAPEWREECLRRHQDILAIMRAQSLGDRRAVLARAEAEHGAEYRRRLEVAVRARWGIARNGGGL